MDPPADVDAVLGLDAPIDPASVLRRCEPFDVDVRGQPVTDLLAPAYAALVQQQP